MSSALIQIHPTGRPVVSKTSFWKLTRDGQLVGWASSYPAAQAKAATLAARAMAS